MDPRNPSKRKYNIADDAHNKKAHTVPDFSAAVGNTSDSSQFSANSLLLLDDDNLDSDILERFSPISFRNEEEEVSSSSFSSPAAVSNNNLREVFQQNEIYQQKIYLLQQQNLALKIRGDSISFDFKNQACKNASLQKANEELLQKNSSLEKELTQKNMLIENSIPPVPSLPTATDMQQTNSNLQSKIDRLQGLLQKKVAIFEQKKKSLKKKL